ncbi:MAG: FAD:protein FMN transferase [Balneolaceae bacterium]|nr:FAD:protein FMN transferase [Balneolaceae bacterium]
MKKISGLFFFSVLLPVLVTGQDLQRYIFNSAHMGTRFSVTLYADDETEANEAAEAVFERIEELNQIMSDYLEDSELNRLASTSGSGEAMELSDPLFEVLYEAYQISEKTDGLFDVTIGPLTKYWRFLRRMPEPELSSEDQLRELLDRVGYQYMELDEARQSVKLDKQGMELDLGGIAKGYAAEEAVRVLRERGIYSSLVDGGGDITLGDPPPGRDYWDVAIPKNMGQNQSSFISLNLTGKTVTTSGDMFQFVEIDGQRYSHILDPKTGLGAVSQIQATVISNKGTWADAYASVLTLLEPEEGIRLIDSLENTEAVIYMNTEEGIQEWMSEGFHDYVRQ